MSEIKVYSTGGGFWTAETELKNGHFATIEFPWINCLTVYTNNEYYEENMIFSKDVEDLDEEETKIYKALFEALNNHLKKFGYT